MATATKTKPTDVEAYQNDALKLINLKKPDFTGKEKVKDLVHHKNTQVRDDTDAGQVVDVKRAEQFAAKMAAGEKFPAVKYMLVEDMPGHKGEPVKLLWDGLHTHAGAEMAKVESIDAIGWKGTWAQALAAAALLANVEHENSGKPKSYKDKIRSAWIIVKGLEAADVPKKEWPNSRQLGAMVGVSHTAINNEEILKNKRAGSKTKAEIEAEKKQQRELAAAAKAAGGVVAAGAAHLGNGSASSIKQFEVVRRATNEVVGTFESETAAGALERLGKKNPGAKLTDYFTRELTPAPKPGSEKTIGFDWQRMDQDFGALARGMDALGEMFDLKKRTEWKTALANLNQFGTLLKAMREEVGKKKPAAKKAETKPESKEEPAEEPAKA